MSEIEQQWCGIEHPDGRTPSEGHMAQFDRLVTCEWMAEHWPKGTYGTWIFWGNGAISEPQHSVSGYIAKHRLVDLEEAIDQLPIDGGHAPGTYAEDKGRLV